MHLYTGYWVSTLSGSRHKKGKHPKTGVLAATGCIRSVCNTRDTIFHSNRCNRCWYFGTLWFRYPRRSGLLKSQRIQCHHHNHPLPRVPPRYSPGVPYPHRNNKYPYKRDRDNSTRSFLLLRCYLEIHHRIDMLDREIHLDLHHKMA